LGQLVSEQQQARVEDNQHHQREANKRPSDLFGTNIIKLMCWCQVTTEDQPPQVWRDLAQAPKGKQRQVLDRAANEAVEALDYKNLNLQVTLAVSKRIIGLEWIMFTDDDLGSGLHPFTVGYITPEQAEDQRKRKRIMTDLIQSGEAVPSLNDAREIMDSLEVHIPFLVTQARFTHMRFLALIQALLTTNHPLVQSYKEFVEEFTACEPELDRARPRNAQNFFIAPALLVRWAQLRVSYWFRRQAGTNRAQPVPLFTELFNDIALERDWAPSFPEKYLKDPSPSGGSTAPPQQPSMGGDGSTISNFTEGTGVSRGGTNPQGGGSCTNSVLTNPADVEPRFKKFKQMHLKARDVKTRAKEEPPENTSKSGRMCPLYHFKGVCNTNCGNATDHISHTDAEDDLLEAWGTKHWKPVDGA
jgi:hypothetical protein